MNSQETVRFTVEHGLSQGFITSIVQDKTGFIWAGTLNGLNRFDGNDFKVYLNDVNDPFTLASNNVQNLITDEYGYLWVFSAAGIQIYDHDNDRFYFPTGLPKTSTNLVRTAVLIKDSQLFMILDNVLQQYKIRYAASGGPQLTFIKSTSLQSSTYGTILDMVLRNGVLWLGTSTGLFNLSFTGEVTRVIPKANKAVFGIWEDKTHQLMCVQSTDGIYFLKDQRVQYFFPGTGVRYGNGAKGIRLKDGNYILSWKSKFWIWDGNALKPFSDSFGAEITAAYSDRQGNVWIGLDALGLACLQNSSKKFNQNFEIGTSAVKAPLIEANGNFWMFRKQPTTLDGDNKFGIYDLQHISSDNTVSAVGRQIPAFHMDIDKEGTKWIVDVHFKLAKINQSNMPEPVIGFCGLDLLNIEFGVNSLPDGTLLLISRLSNKICFYDPKSERCIEIRNGKKLLRRSIWDVSALTKPQSPDGWTWITGTHTVVGIKPNWSRGTYALRYLDNKKLGKAHADDPRFIFAQPDLFAEEVIWIGTWDGLFRWNTAVDTVEQISLNQFTTPGAVFCLAQTEPDVLWLGAQNGLIRYNVFSKHGKQFTVVDGLPASEFNRNTASVSRDGKIIMGTVNGFIAFYPDELKTEEYPEPLVISSVRQGLTYLPLKREGANYSINTLPNGSGNLLVYFSMLDFTTLKAAQYRFRYPDISEEWFYNGLKNNIALAGLSAGKYIIEVQGSKDGNKWSQSAFLKFRIESPWWAKIWVISLGILVAGLTIILIFRNRRLLLVEKHKNELLKQQAEHEASLTKAKERILINIAHELRTPVTLITGMADTLISQKNQSVNEVVETINRQSTELLSLITQILDLGKIRELGQTAMNYQEINLQAFLPALVSGYSFQADLKSIRLECNFSTHIPSFFLDEQGLRTILGNLLSNALKFTPQGGNVRVEVEMSDTHLQLFVKDSGSGITPEDADKIFMRYFQAESNTQIGGTGIGLAYASEMAQLLGGKLEYLGSNESGVGSVFLLSFPLEKLDIPDEREKQSKSNVKLTEYQEDNIIAHKEKHLIVLIEDIDEMASFITGILEPDFDVVRASNGSEGVEKIIELTPDLVISDIMMPVLSGLDVCRIVRDDMRTSHIPIILLTAKAGEEDIRVGLNSGADLYLTKPFDARTLKQYVHNSLQLIYRTKKYFEQQWKETPSITDLTPIAENLGVSIQEPLFITKVKSLIEANFHDETFTVEKLANELLVSVSQLRRKILALGGEPAGAMLKNYRLNKAKVLLKDTPERTISEVAFACGFSDPNYFSTAFSKAFGVSPKEFRKTG